MLTKEQLAVLERMATMLDEEVVFPITIYLEAGSPEEAVELDKLSKDELFKGKYGDIAPFSTADKSVIYSSWSREAGISVTIYDRSQCEKLR